MMQKVVLRKSLLANKLDMQKPTMSSTKNILYLCEYHFRPPAIYAKCFWSHAIYFLTLKEFT